MSASPKLAFIELGMPDTVDVLTLTNSAAEAAARDDLATATGLLRRALELQIAQLGPDHRELAPTLNNLALMLERQGEIREAGRCYRRAYDVARRGADPNDPAVEVTRLNLRDFLAASGQPGLEETVSPAPLVDSSPGWGPRLPIIESPLAQARPSAPIEPSRPPRTMTPPPSAARPSSIAPPPVVSPHGRRRNAGARTGTLGLVLIIALLGAAALWWVVTRSETSSDTPEVASAPDAATQRDGAPAPDPTGSPEAPRAPEPSSTPPARGETASPPARNASPDPAAITAETSLCQTLSRSGGRWQCTPPDEPVRSAALYYYTRVKSARGLVVRHRWTHEGRVVRNVDLSVRANPKDGFRTFSRQSVGSRGAGDWEVSLLGPGGVVIDTQRFTVR